MPNECPSADLLSRYATGALAEVEASAVDTHIGYCTVCIDRLSRLDEPADGVMAALRKLPAAPPDDSPALARAVAAVKSGGALLPPPELALGTELNGYRVVEELGRGGMGRVYRAAHPRLDQEVALKVLRPGLDSAPVLARFEAERQALARMDHPHIARVFDGGATAEGQPFFAMELIRGVPITRYCDDHHLDVRRRLDLFMTVCQAVQHAHQKGIIHRDLKPSNVLVTEYDGRPVAKVIDFGLAKPIDRRSAGETEVGMLVGTPESMSPEQADLTSLDIDTRTDVYALGALLYELLTGDTPFERRRLRAAPVLEVLRIVREEEPPAPSTRLSADPAEVAARRGAEPSKLVKQVRGELDWIALKALEKDRARRYETAAALADDVQRYLAHEPVLAGPPSRRYRVKKFVRRHRGAVLAASLILLALVGGMVGTLTGMVRARRESENAQAALAAETAARKQAMATLRSLTDSVVERQMARQVTLTDDDRKFLRKIVAEYEAFAALRGDGEESRGIRAEGHARVGLLRRYLGEPAAALESFERASEIYQGLAADFPAVAEYRSDLALALGNMAMMSRTTGELGRAESLLRQSRAFLEPLAEAFPENPTYRRGLARAVASLADLQEHLGKHPEAEAEYGFALRLRREVADAHPEVGDYRSDVSETYVSRGTWLMERGRHAEAEADFRESLRIDTGLIADFPDEPIYRLQLAQTHNNLANLFGRIGQFADEDAARQQTIALYKQLAADFPLVPRYRQQLASAHNNRGANLRRRGDRPQAEAEWRLARGLREQLANDFPQVPAYRHDLARSHFSLGSLLEELGNRPEAEEECRKAVAVGKQLVKDFPGVPDYLQDLAKAHNNLGVLLKEARKFPEAETEYRQALDLRNQLAADSPDRPEYRNDLARTHLNLGNLLQDQKRFPEAEAEYRRSLDLKARLAADFPDMVTYRLDLSNSHNNLGNTLKDMGRFAESEAEHRRGLALREQLVRDFPTQNEYALQLNGSYINFGNLLRESGKLDESLVWYQRAIELQTPFLAREPRHVFARRTLRNGHLGRAQALMRLQRFADALPDWTRTLELDDGRNNMILRAMRAICLARLEPAHAVTDIEELLKGDTVPNEMLILGARVYAVCSAHVSDPSLGEQHAVRAMSLLNQARTGSHFKDKAQTEELQKERDFDPLRAREDFQKLLAELAPKTVPNPLDR